MSLDRKSGGKLGHVYIFDHPLANVSIQTPLCRDMGKYFRANLCFSCRIVKQSSDQTVAEY